MALTLQEVLRLAVLREAQVVAGHDRLDVPVRWCHVAEVLDIARLLTGGELLLTTGLALDVEPDRQAAYIGELKERGVAGLMLELGRKFAAAPTPLVAAAERVGLPLITLAFDTPFVKVTEAVHTLVLSRQPAPGGAPDPAMEQQLLADLAGGQIAQPADLRRRLEALGRALPEPTWLAFLAVDGAARPEQVRTLATIELGPQNWLFGRMEGEGWLAAISADRHLLAAGLRGLAGRLLPHPAGVGRCYPALRAAESLTEARQTLRLRRQRPSLDPLFAQAGVYRLALGRDSEDARLFVAEWLGPLIQYDRVHRTNLCETLRMFLDDRLVVAEAARRLHLTRQGLYHRQQRIAEVLGRDLNDPEVRLALSVALRFREALEEELT